MNLRDTKSRLILIVVAIGLVLVIVVASCGGGDEQAGAENGSSAESATDDGAGGGDSEEEEADGDSDGDGDDARSDPIAQVSGEADITLTVTRAVREEGGFLTVEGTLANGGGSNWRANEWRGPENELSENGFSMAGATLTAKAEGKRYLILRDTSGRCLCTRFDLQLEAGQTVTWFAQFPEPDAATTEVDFQIGQMPPATFEIS